MSSSLISHQHLMNANAEQEREGNGPSLIVLSGFAGLLPGACSLRLIHAASSPPLCASARANFPASSSVVS